MVQKYDEHRCAHNVSQLFWKKEKNIGKRGERFLNPPVAMKKHDDTIFLRGTSS